MTSVVATTTIERVILDVPDPAAAEAFSAHAFGLADRLAFRARAADSSGFRGFTLSLVVGQPSTVDSLIGTALAAGASELKAVKKSFWGYGGVVQAPDGTIWKVASSAKKDTAPPTREIDDLVLLLGVADVKASKRFYVERGFTVDKSFGGKYAQFDAPGDGITLALYGREALAKDAGVAPDGTGPHGIAIVSAAAPFTDPDGFAWEQPAV